MSTAPLVSIMIPNYNHSRYLPECIESAQNQTYKNLEIVVLDNQSQDDSIAVAAQYARQNVRVCRNACNTLNQSYSILARCLTHGKYLLLLCADDYIEPDFIERAVAIMEQHPNVGYVHGERDFVLPNGQVIELDPFYNCSFTAPGGNDTAIYMVTTVAHPSQGVFRRSAFERVGGYNKAIDHANADRMLWFYLSQVSDYAYIRDKMCRIRIGEQTETFIAQENFQHPILMYLTIKTFVDCGKKQGLESVVRREDEALNRLAVELLDCAKGMIVAEKWKKADEYLKFCYVISRDIAQHSDYVMIRQMVEEKRADIEALRKTKQFGYAKKRSYSPPPGYIEL